MRSGWWIWIGLVACTGGGDASPDGTPADGSSDTPAESGTDTGIRLDAPPRFSEGTRLEAAYWDAGDDARLLAHWTDTELGIDCRLTRDPAGTLRCLPFASVNLAYLDAACTEPVFYWEPCSGGTPPAQVTGVIGLGCADARTGVPYATGARVEVDHAYRADDCTRMDFPKLREYYRAVEQPASDYVSYTEANVAIADGLGVHHLQGSDGSGYLSSLAHMAAGQACTAVNLGTDYATHCVPGEKAYDFDRAHTDAECTNGDAAMIFGAPSCPRPLYVLSTEPHPTCDRTYTELREAGDPIDRSDVYWGTPGGCFPSPEDRTFYEVGPPAGSGLPPLDTAPVGTGRLRLDHWISESGTPLLPAAFRWFDTTLGLTCGRYDTVEGSRCLPAVRAQSVTHTYVQYFADAACTDAPLVYHYEDPCFPTAPPALAADYETGLCGAQGPLQNVREVGPRHAGPVYVALGAKCDLLAPGDHEVFYSVGSPVTLGDYAPIPLRDSLRARR